jgi:DNA-binding protein H-NS
MQMAKTNLVSMSIEDLLTLRDDIGRVLSKKSEQLRQQLAALGADIGRHIGPKARVSAMRGRKVAPKYRNPKEATQTWAGRGAMPRWMAAEIKKGKKREHFAIDKSPGKSKKRSLKASRGKRKTASGARRTKSKVAASVPTAQPAT